MTSTVLDENPIWQIRGADRVWMPYCQMKTAPAPIAVSSTDGMEIVLADGRRLVDGLASWWSACHGYNHPHVVQAIQDQTAVMPHVMMGGIHHEPALRLARRLTDLLPGDLNRAFFVDSGSVALELAMKMAIQWQQHQRRTSRKQFLTFDHAYHGDTTGAMSLCDPRRSMHRLFGAGILQQHHLAIPQCESTLADFERFVSQNESTIAAVVIEPLVQGAGGMRFHSAAVLRQIRDVCDRYELLMVADELATGFGRTGSMFAIEQADIVPDIICLGKALTAGAIGMAANVATDRVFEAFWSDDASAALMHGPTFMGNPLACAAANASLDLFETNPILDQVAALERRLTEALEPCRDHSEVVDVRCKGAIGAVQVRDLGDVDRLRQWFIDQGVWIRPFGDCIYITPPLNIDQSSLKKLTDAMVGAASFFS